MTCTALSSFHQVAKKLIWERSLWITQVTVQCVATQPLPSGDTLLTRVSSAPMFLAHVLGKCQCSSSAPVVWSKLLLKSRKANQVAFALFLFPLSRLVWTWKSTPSDFGKLKIDIGFGGAFYAIVNGDRLGIDVCSSSQNDIVDAANVISSTVKSQIRLHHPDNEELAFLYGTILTDGNDMFHANSQEPTANVVVFADSQVKIQI